MPIQQVGLNWFDKDTNLAQSPQLIVQEGPDSRIVTRPLRCPRQQYALSRSGQNASAARPVFRYGLECLFHYVFINEAASVSFSPSRLIEPSGGGPSAEQALILRAAFADHQVSVSIL